MGGEAQEYQDLDMVGFTCIEGDVLYHNYTGKLAHEDAIVISNCGSYSLVMKPPFILPNFPVLDICDGEVEVIKRGETFDDLFHTFKFSMTFFISLVESLEQMSVASSVSTITRSSTPTHAMSFL